MAVAAHHLTTNGSGTDNQPSYSTASITPTADRLVLALVATARSSGTATQPTLAGNGLTWDAISTVSLSSTRVTLYRTMGAAPSAGAVTITPGSDTNTVRVLWSISEFSGIDTSGTNGSGAIVQTPATNQANVASITATLSAFSDAANATYGGFLATATGRTWTAGSGFSQIAAAFDLSGENASIFTEFRADNDTTVNASISGGGTQMWAFGVEIKSAAPSAAPRAIMYARRRGR